MRLALLTALVMTAFAANSLLNRAALTGEGTDALTIAAIRLASGAAALSALVLATRGANAFRAAAGVIGPLSLLAYMLGFSLAYRTLDAGLGALILFGTVQLTMFGGGLIAGERPPPARWTGAALALAGLGWMVWPSGPVQVPPGAAALMAAAGVGWGVYSLHGRRAADPLSATAMNFLLATPAAAALLLLPGAAPRADPSGVALALAAGVLTSGLGYALWYAVLPRLLPSAAALAQLTVPVIALAGGALILAEPVAPATALAAALVLGGVAIGLLFGTRGRAL